MGRLKCQGRSSRDKRLTKKGDTPLKTGLTTGTGRYRRLLPKKHYETLQEEPLLDDSNIPTVKPGIQMSTNRRPLQYKKVVHFRSPVFTETPRAKNVSAATPATQNAGNKVPMSTPANQTTPDPNTYKEEEQSRTVTEQTSVSSDDDEEDCYSSASTSSGTLPSPEIFCREENCVESAFQMDEELLDLHLHVKNSTLLDASRAENIYMYQPPNMSTIIDASMSLAEKEREISYCRRTEAEPKRFKSDKAPKTTPKLTNRRPIRYKKKVCFNSPVLAEILGAKNIPATKHNAGDPVLTCSPANLMTTDAETLEAEEIIPEEDTIPLKVTLKRPAKTSPEQVSFFDFADDSDRDAFFKRLRDRYAKLRNAPLFPLEAAR